MDFRKNTGWLAAQIRHVRRIVKPLLPNEFVRRHYFRARRPDGPLFALLPYGLVRMLKPDVWPCYGEMRKGFEATCGRIAEKIRSGRPVKTVFFVTDASLFPAKPLFDAMLADGMFDPEIVVIPDLRWYGVSPFPAMESCRQELVGSAPEDKVSVAALDESGEWKDVLQDADIVCYPLPYETSAEFYNPKYAAGKDFLPICANYGYYRSVFDKLVMAKPHYALMWKAFFECEANMREYAESTSFAGANGVLTGYIKMDALAKVSPEPGCRRRKILVALHHSVEGGMNRDMSLANIVRYADYFASLPDRYPEIDFIFRPHPFLWREMSRPSQWGAAKTNRYIASLKSKPNVIWSDGGDYFKAFAESDACIQDCGSYLVEYFYTKKPCCYMLKSPDDIVAKFATLGRECLANCYISYDTAAIDRFIEDVVIGMNDPKKAGRETLADRLMVNYPNAAKAALEGIKASLKGGAA